MYGTLITRYVDLVLKAHDVGPYNRQRPESVDINGSLRVVCRPYSAYLSGILCVVY